MLTFSNPIVGGTVLIRPAIRSPNYVAGSAGWTVNADGSAEFNNVVIRGAVSIGGTSLFYSTPVPAAGTLVASVGSAGGTDSAGNTWLPGTVTYDSIGGSEWSALQLWNTALTCYISAIGSMTGWTQASQVLFGSSINVFTFSQTVFANVVQFGAAVTAGAGAAVTGGLSADTLAVSGAVTLTGGTSGAPSLVTTDTWHAVTPAGGFTAGSPAPQYALLPWGVNGSPTIALRGQILANATAAGAVMFTVPYTFGRTYDFVTANNLTGYALGNRVVRMATGGGNVQCMPATTATNSFVLLDGCMATLT